MKVFRITKRRYQNDISGKGAELFGGRWNPIGIPALYTSESRALCVLELLVHTPKELTPPTYIIQSIEIPKKLEKHLKVVDSSKFKSDWDKLQYPEWTENLGAKIFKENYLGFVVPSAIVKMEKNIVLNPMHKDFNKTIISNKIEFELDKRLLK